MQDDLNVILVDDDRELCDEISKCIEETDGLELLATTDSSDEALEYVRHLRPDAVILDLELHQGGGNGIVFLTKLSKLTDIKRPFVLVNTHNSSSTTHEIVRKLGADFVMYKHQEGYCAQEVADFLLAVRAGKGDDSLCQPSLQQSREQSETLRSRILAELNNIGISPRSRGYNYLADAIEIFCGGQIPNVSSVIGAKYNKSEASVERAMQNAIDRAWNRADINELLTYYTARVNSKRISPTVMEFVCYYAAKLKS